MFAFTVVSCPSIGVIGNGTVGQINNSSYLTTVKIVCDVGYLVSPDSDHNVMLAHCTDAQKWTVIEVGNETRTVKVEQEMDLPTECAGMEQ